MTYTSVWTCPWTSRWEEPVADVRGTRLVSQPVSLSIIQPEPAPPMNLWVTCGDLGVKFNSQDVCCQSNFSSLKGELWLSALVDVFFLEILHQVNNCKYPIIDLVQDFCNINSITSSFFQLWQPAGCLLLVDGYHQLDMSLRFEKYGLIMEWKTPPPCSSHGPGIGC